ncbi:MAG: META domain-containing protein [Myxococcales bacterium]|nr:META domain-containing protein [Myxococcales bacterium]
MAARVVFGVMLASAGLWLSSEAWPEPGGLTLPADAAPSGTCPLTDQRWNLVELAERPVGPAVAAGPPVQVLLEADSERVGGFGGCNPFEGRYERGTHGELHFHGLVVSLMVCASSPDEEAFLRALAHSDRFDLEGGRLTLWGADGAPLARFVAAE